MEVLSAPDAINLDRGSTASISTGLAGAGGMRSIFTPVEVVIRASGHVCLARVPRVVQDIGRLLDRDIFGKVRNISACAGRRCSTLVLSPARLRVHFTRRIPLRLLSQCFAGLRRSCCNRDVNQVVFGSGRRSPICLLGSRAGRIFAITHPTGLLRSLTRLCRDRGRTCTRIRSCRARLTVSCLPVRTVAVRGLVCLIRGPSGDCFVSLLFSSAASLGSGKDSRFIDCDSGVSRLDVSGRAKRLDCCHGVLSTRSLPSCHLVHSDFRRVGVLSG